MSASRLLASLSPLILVLATCTPGDASTSTFGASGSNRGDDDDDNAGSSAAGDDDDDVADDDDDIADDDDDIAGDDDDDDSNDSLEITSVGTSGLGIRFDVGTPVQETDSVPIGNCQNKMYGVLRDFSQSHPDFENDIQGEDPGLVETMLGPDGKPVYAGGTNGTTTGKEAFDQWFRDDPVNFPLPIAIPFDDPDGDGTYTFEDSSFFPADGEGFGNEDNAHNYHFTLEARSSFTYEGGEIFRFRGDDDLFVFVNGRLAMDLGGVHLPLIGIIDMDAQAADLGLTLGETYTLDFFFAERHTLMSNFRIDTSIACFFPEG